MYLGAPRNRFAVRDLRFARDHLAVVLAPHALHVDVEVELAHAADDGLLRLFVLVHAEGRVFFREAIERLRKVRLGGAVLRCDRERDDGRGHVHRRQRQIDLAVRERFAGASLDAVERDDVACFGGRDLLAVLGVHTEHARDAHFPHLVARIEDGIAGRNRPLIDAEVRELPVLVLLQLERQADERLRRIRVDHDFLFALALIVRLVDDVGRTGEVVHDAVEEQLHALVLDRRSAHHGGHLESERCPTDRGAQLLHRDRLFVDELLGELVVDVGDVMNDGLARRGCGLCELRRDFFFANGLSVRPIEEEGFADNRVDDSPELRLRADRDLDLDGVVSELFLEHVRDALVVRARIVHLVDEGDPRHAVALHLLVDGDRLALNPLARVEDENRAVEDAQRALDLDREVHVTGGIDDVDVVGLKLLLRSVPNAVGRGRLDRDALLALEIHRVHLGADAVLAAHLVDLVNSTRVKEDALGERRLPGVDVRRDADVADAV